MRRTSGIKVHLWRWSMQKLLTEIDIERINQNFWDTLGADKSFPDPFFIEEFVQNIPKESSILDYGCGYGRLIKILIEAGYQNIIGFERSKGMLKRAEKFLDDNAHIISNYGDLQKDSFDATVLSTVLCCISGDDVVEDVVDKVTRVLKPNGLLYFCDFLTSEFPKYIVKYNEGLKEFGVYGVYKTNEIVVRHFSKTYLLNLFKGFQVVWSKDIQCLTMNNNPALQTHMILKRAS